MSRRPAGRGLRPCARRAGAAVLTGLLVVCLVLAVETGLRAPAARADPDAASGSDEPGGTASATHRQAVDALSRAAAVAREQPWTGTQVVSSWGPGGVQSAVLDVLHRPGQGSSVRVHPTTGPPGATLPLGPLALADAPTPSASTGAKDADMLGLLERNYSLDIAGPAPCLGRSCRLVMVSRPLDGRPAARLWLDDATGLVIRREVLDAGGGMVRMSLFSDLQVGPGVGDPPPGVRAVADQPHGELLPPARLAELRSAGWAMPEALPDGMSLLECRMLASAALPPAAQGGPVAHLTYGDGLSTMSLFVQQGRLTPEPLAGWHPAQVAGRPVLRGDGTPLRLTWNAAGMVLTLLADGPPEAVDAVVAALPHDPPPPPATPAADEPGAGERLQRGLQRMGSWVNPFD